MTPKDRERGESLRNLVLNTFREYGGWWKLSGMAEWLDAKEEDLKSIWDALEAEGLLERR